MCSSDLAGAAVKRATGALAGLRARALKAVGELGLADHRVTAEANLQHEDDECRFWAAWTAGLLGSPDMHITGNNSYWTTLNWFADRSDSQLPVASVLSVPMWCYKVLILAWALWFSFALLKWLPWTWDVFAEQGFFRGRKDESAAEAG